MKRTKCIYNAEPVIFHDLNTNLEICILLCTAFQLFVYINQTNAMLTLYFIYTRTNTMRWGPYGFSRIFWYCCRNESPIALLIWISVLLCLALDLFLLFSFLFAMQSAARLADVNTRRPRNLLIFEYCRPGYTRYSGGGKKKTEYRNRMKSLTTPALTDR